jgi:hypothetical protein
MNKNSGKSYIFPLFFYETKDLLAATEINALMVKYDMCQPLMTYQ